MKVLPPILCMILVGCSSGGSGDGNNSCRDVAHAYEYDQIDPATGVTLKATINEIGEFVSFISFERMVEEYVDVEACAVDMNTPGPGIVFSSFNHFNFRSGGGSIELALYNYTTQEAWIDTDFEDHLPIRNCISDREFLRHEFMHHILYLNGQDSSHLNPKFAECSALGPKTCNGQYCEK